MKVSALEIEHWINTNPRRAQEELPELIKKLISYSSPNARITCPSGNNISVKGFDGYVESDYESNSFVPYGKSIWECGTNENYKGKIKEDFEKRTKQTPVEEQKEYSFVLITGRRFSNTEEKVNLEKELKKKSNWRDIKIYDATDIEELLEKALPVKIWFARLIGKISDNVYDIDSFWSFLSKSTKPEFTYDMVIIGRDEISKEIIDDLERNIKLVKITGKSIEEIVYFLIASILKYKPELKSKTLIITDKKDWDNLLLTNINGKYILIPAFKDTPQVSYEQAIKQGHIVIKPIISRKRKENSIFIEKATPYRLEGILINVGFPEGEAKKLANLSKGDFLCLKNYISTTPIKLVKDEYKDFLKKFFLIGGFSKQNEYKDKELLDRFFGMPYSEIENHLQMIYSLEKSPLEKTYREWILNLKSCVWSEIKDFISESDLEKFKDIFIKVFSETDPRIYLDPDKRWYANIQEKDFSFSSVLRRNLAEVYLILSAYKNDLTLSNVENILWSSLNEVFKNFLNRKELWYSLRNELDLLIEANPKFFIEKIQEDLTENTEGLAYLLKDEADPIIGECKHCNLLWGLESLVWNKDYIFDVVYILARLSEIDNGGYWANRPFNTLVQIFLPWFPQNPLSFEEMIKVLKILNKRLPETTFKLLINLLDDPHATTYIHTPYFQDWYEGNLKRDISYTDFWKFKNDLFGILMENKFSTERLDEIIEIIDKLPYESFNILLQKIKEIYSFLDDEKKSKLFEILYLKICRHRHFPDAKWVLKEDLQRKLFEILHLLIPQNIIYKYKYLFNHWEHDLLCKSLDIENKYEKQINIIYKLRRLALKRILSLSGINGIRKLALLSEHPEFIGRVLAEMNLSEEVSIISWLFENNENLKRCASSFIEHKFQNYPNFMKQILAEERDLDKKVEILLQGYVNDHFIENFLKKLDSKTLEEYFAKFNNLNGYIDKVENIEWFTEHLIKTGKPILALHHLSHLRNTEDLDIELIYELFNSLLFTKEKLRIDRYSFERIFSLLYKNNLDDEKWFEKLFILEWKYIPLFKNIVEDSNFRPKALFKKIKENPEFFAELIKFALESDNRTIEKELEELANFEQLSENAYELIQIYDEIPYVENCQRLKEWIYTVKHTCENYNRNIACNFVLGKLLSKSPKDENDNIFPNKCIREILEENYSKELAESFITEVFNSVGVVSNPEEAYKSLAKEYENYSEQLRFEFPNTYRILKEISTRFYEASKRWESNW